MQPVESFLFSTLEHLSEDNLLQSQTRVRNSKCKNCKSEDAIIQPSQTRVHTASYCKISDNGLHCHARVYHVGVDPAPVSFLLFESRHLRNA